MFRSKRDQFTHDEEPPRSDAVALDDYRMLLAEVIGYCEPKVPALIEPDS
jgi:hypothetical protein